MNMGQYAFIWIDGRSAPRAPAAKADSAKESLSVVILDGSLLVDVDGRD